MPVVRDPGDLPARQGAGWAEQAWAGPQELGAPVPMQAWRWSLAPMAASPPIGLGAPEGLLYVMAGAGTAETDGGAVRGRPGERAVAGRLPGAHAARRGARA